MNYSAGDLLDRLSIVRLKYQRLKELSNLYEPELNSLTKECSQYLSISLVNSLNDILHNANATIWDLEKDIRTGALDNNIARVGELAIYIRKVNALRCGLKNVINTITDTGFQEIKIDHVSEKK